MSLGHSPEASRSPEAKAENSVQKLKRLQKTPAELAKLMDNL